MSARERMIRVLIGVGIIGLVVVTGFAVAQNFIPTWGATPSEVARGLPGDELYPTPLVNWTHAITIDAPAHQVWQWIAQIGEGRAGYYSYTFIENQMGNGDVYHNADRIVPEWQNPQPGDNMIKGGLQVGKVEPGKWLLANSMGGMGWTWLWYVEPLDANHARLIVRNHIQPPAELSNPMMGMVLTFGGFVMEQGMLRGIQARAEGNIPPPYGETLAIVVWVLALAAGIVAAVFFVAFKEWKGPLALAILSVVSLFVFTFVQPELWLRVVVDLALWGGLVWVVADQRAKRSTPRARREERPATMTVNPSH